MSVRPSEQGSAAYKSEEMIFHPSATTTVGAELELMLLDPDSGDLAPGAIRLLKACAEEQIDGVSAELMQSMIELKTGVCQNVADVREQLVPRLRRVRNIARSMGYQLAMSGTHPFHRPSNSAVTPSERYDRLVDRLAYLIHQRVVFGLHIHVGLPDGDMALGVMNQLVRYLPHLLALSASSPFWQGIDTGLASCRTALYRTLPHAGVPRYFPRWKNFRSYFRVMRECAAIQSMKDIYWDIRPRPEFGTIELRVCDMPATLETTFALVAFVRSLAIASQRLLEEHPQLQRGDIRRNWIAVENKWLATRYGLEAIYIRTPAGKRRPLRQDLQELLNRLMPIAAETGDDVFLSTLLPLDKFEPDADRQRRLYRESGKARVLVDDMITRLASELDEVPPSATGSSGAASSRANGATLADSPEANPLERLPGVGPPNADAPDSDGPITDQANVDRASVESGPRERITIDQPAATPRASAPPTAGTLNRSEALDLPGSVLFRSAGANAGPAADRQLALAVRG